MTLEQCSDVIVSITQIIPDFKTVLRFNDLHLKPDEIDLQKRVRYHAALYHLRNKIVKNQNYDDAKIKKYMKKLFDKRREEKLGKLDKQNNIEK